MSQSSFFVLGIAFTAWLIALACRTQDRSWVSPGSIFAMVWAAYMPTLLFFASDATPYLAGLLWILGSVASASAGSAIAGALCPPVVARKVEVSSRAVAVLRHLVKWPIAIGLADTVWLFAQRGFSFSALLSLKALMLVSAANRGEAYAGESDTPVLERLGFTAMYLGTLYGGVLFRLGRSRSDKFQAVCTLLVLILINTLHGSRFGSIYGGAFWLSAYLATHVALANPKKGVGAGFLVRFAGAGVLIVFVFSVLTMLVRYAVFAGDETNPVSWSYMLSDPFGFVAAFGVWFGQTGTHPDGPFLGARVFRRIVALWGNQYPLYEPVDVGFNTSNVFTIFRELIEDFTLVGSLEVLLFYGFVGRIAFWASMRTGNRIALPVLAVVYIFAFTSVATSAFAYTTITAAALLFVGSFYFLPRIAVRPNTRAERMATPE